MTTHPVLYSKLYGLEQLHRTLAGVEGVDVIPYRVYNSATEVHASHFPRDARRFLVRVDAIPTGEQDGYEILSWINTPSQSFCRATPSGRSCARG